MDNLRQRIEKYPNHHLLGGRDTAGGMEQNYDEFEQLCCFIIDRKISSIMEIGLGTAKTHEFFVNELKLDAEAISPEKIEGVKQYVGKSQDPEILKQCRHFYDMVFVDGDHTYESVMADYNNFKKKCRYMAFHDCLGFRDCLGSKQAWLEIKKKHEHWEFFCEDLNIASGIGVIKLR